MKPRLDLETFARQEEGQLFDRKSLLTGAPGSKRVRDRVAGRGRSARYVPGPLWPAKEQEIGIHVNGPKNGPNGPKNGPNGPGSKNAK